MTQDSVFISTELQNIEEVLFDSGGTADCYKLIKDNRIYCIKRPKPQYCDSEAYMSLFRKEFELGIDMEHPNIVRYFAYDTDERGPFIRMDFVDGDNLEEFVETMGMTAKRKEGVAEGRWAVLDFGDVIVHIFNDEQRLFYHLERIWGEGEKFVD